MRERERERDTESRLIDLCPTPGRGKRVTDSSVFPICKEREREREREI
jgi:hypothetical protein